MTLREKLALLLLLGTSAFLGTTALVRGAVEHRTQRLRCEAAARSSQDDALTEISRRSALLRSKLALWRSAVERAGADLAPGGDPARVLARAAEDGLDVRDDEAVLLAAPSGEIVAAAGGLAEDRGGIADALSRGGVIGRSGPGALRAGLVPHRDAPTLAASVTVPLGGTASLAGALHRVVVAVEVDLESVANRARGEVRVDALDGEALPPALTRAASRLWEEGRGEDQWFEDDRALVVRVLEDALGRPAFLLSTSAPMPEIGLVPAWAREALLWEAVAAFLAIAIALWFLDRRVLRPIRTIEERARQLARSEHGALGFLIAQRGEIGQLVDSLEAMLVRVRDERRDLLRAALGESEDGSAPAIACDHRATLERARTALDAVIQRLDPVATAELRSMADALEGFDGDLARFAAEHPDGRFLAPFLTATADTLEAARRTSARDLTAIGRTLEHVTGRPDTASGGARQAEAGWDVSDAIERSIDVARVAYGALEGLEIERELQRMAPAEISYDRFSTALVHLVGHCLGVLAEEEPRDRVLTVRAYPMDTERFVVEVEDSGPGAAPDALHLAFTGEGGASSDLVVARELLRDLGVSVGIASGGEGRGTTYKLRAPRAPASAAPDRAA